MGLQVCADMPDTMDGLAKYGEVTSKKVILPQYVHSCMRSV
jgi:hypothetical protein